MEWDEVEGERAVEGEDVPGDEVNPLSCSPPICEGKKRKRRAEHSSKLMARLDDRIQKEALVIKQKEPLPGLGPQEHQ